MVTVREIEKGIWDKEYMDKNGDVINADDYIKYPSGRVERVYLTEDGCLGTDATNPDWIKSGRAVPCEYGIYPFSAEELIECEVIPRAEYEGTHEEN